MKTLNPNIFFQTSLMRFSSLQEVPPVILDNFLIISDFEIFDERTITFKSSKPLKNVTNFTGFKITGKTISSIGVINTQTNTYYFDISEADLNYFDNLQISYSGGSDVQSTDDISLYPFNLTSVKNKLQYSTSSTRVLYVASNATGSANGLTEANPFTMSQMLSNLQAGDKVYIKKGLYTGQYTIPRSGTLTAPILFEGYENNIGDLSYDVSHSQYPNVLNANKMPLFQGNRNTDTLFTMNGKSFIVFKNINVKNYKRGFYSSYTTPCTNIVFDNCSGEEFGSLTNTSKGDGLFINITMNGNFNKPSKIRVQNCYGRNASLSNFTIGGDNNLIYNCKSYNDAEIYTGTQDLNLSTDYHFRIGDGNNSTISKCHAENIGDQQHGAHGFSIRGFYLQTENNLVEHSKSVNINGSVEFRNDHVNKCYANNIHILGGFGRRNGGLDIRDGATNCIFQNSIIDGITGTTSSPKGAISLYETSESGALNTNDNIKIINTVIKNCQKTLYFEGGNHSNIELINCTLHNNDYLYHIYTGAEQNTLTNSKFINCLIHNIPNEKFGTTSLTGWSFEHCNFYTYWNANGTIESGLNNISINPNFNNSNDLKPLNQLLKAGKYISTVLYDLLSNKRQNPPTIGAVELSIEGADNPPPVQIVDDYPQDNTASINEVDSVGSWGHSSSTTQTDTDSYNGSKSIKIISKNASYGRSELNLALEVSQPYKITMYTKATQGNKQRLASWFGFDSTPNVYISETVWTKREFILTPTTATQKLRVYASSGGAVGDSLLIDNITIIKN